MPRNSSSNPYGRAAVAALKHENLYEKVEAKLVLGENISQTVQFVQSGNADVGIIAIAVKFLDFLKTPESRASLARFGFSFSQQ